MRYRGVIIFQFILVPATQEFVIFDNSRFVKFEHLTVRGGTLGLVRVKLGLEFFSSFYRSTAFFGFLFLTLFFGLNLRHITGRGGRLRDSRISL